MCIRDRYYADATDATLQVSIELSELHSDGYKRQVYGPAIPRSEVRARTATRGFFSSFTAIGCVIWVWATNACTASKIASVYGFAFRATSRALAICCLLYTSTERSRV